MKLPTYVTKEQKIKILQLFQLVKTTEGIKQALLLKRMILVAAYGTMISGKITFDDFIRELRNHLITKEKTLDTFWNIRDKALRQDAKMFLIPYEIVYRDNNNTLEKTIANLYATRLNINNIKDVYIKPFLKMFPRH